MRFFLIVGIFSFLVNEISSQALKKMEFQNQEITDILLVLAELGGTSILADETVRGRTSFYFSDSNFEDVFSLFLRSNNLFSIKKDNAYIISRIKTDYDSQKNLVSIEADDVQLELLIRSIMKSIGLTIVYDPLPEESLSIHIGASTIQQALHIIMRRFEDYMILEDDGYWYIKKKRAQPSTYDSRNENNSAIKKEGEKYSISIEKMSLHVLLSELFSHAGSEYSILSRNVQIENIVVSGRSFDELLHIILRKARSDYTINNGVYTIFEIETNDSVNYKKTTVIDLRHLQAQELPNLLPAELASGNLFRVDKQTNSLIVTGSDEEIRPILDFIALVDRPQECRSYVRIDARYLKVKDLLALIPGKLLPVPPFVIPESNSFGALVSDEGIPALREFIDLVDRKSAGLPIRLRYIKNEDLLKNLPPSVFKEEIVDSGAPNLVFFTGSEDKWRMFTRDLALIDRPKPQLRYEFLVVQYDDGANSTWKRSLNVSDATDQPDFAFLGGIANILTLNFDVVSQFGHLFAAKLSLEMGENRARVFADTTLNALSGQEVKFQNTSTFRYRETEIDEDTGKPKSTGVTREITSGLIVGLNGWVSGDGMVTMSVAATVSKRGADTSSSTGDPPPTSERVVATQVRTASGTPVVIAGLLQKETTRNVKKIPLLGDIPLLGYLFKDVVEKEENIEIVLYVVPHIVWGDDTVPSDAGAYERRYRAFVADYVK